eukprot:TRINITY_DN21888_c0_g1_i1.p1 TRINITY_DN21888_c0_g1~~TRINITY_DN21888_c0_g1_i1.p1  ORF type:complete len:463 (+),score=86.29 TRINITY_DN21888_c0_g1_i1:43-1431(+)
MEVLYDARVDCAGNVPPLSEWLQSYPKLASTLQSCAARFVANLSEDDVRAVPRLCCELQEGFWFYLDYEYEGAKKELPKLNQTSFIVLMVEACDRLRTVYPSARERNALLHEWREYMRQVPIRGAIVFNQKMDKCLMVQPWRGDKWMYPRGKINQGETDAECAEREVWEETGVDIKGNISAEHYLTADIYGTGNEVKLFLVSGIGEEVHCAPNTRREIGKIGWIPLTKLPGWQRGRPDDGLRFTGVAPFVADIRRWVEQQRKDEQRQHLAQQLGVHLPANGSSTNGYSASSSSSKKNGARRSTQSPPGGQKVNGDESAMSLIMAKIFDPEASGAGLVAAVGPVLIGGAASCPAKLNGVRPRNGCSPPGPHPGSNGKTNGRGAGQQKDAASGKRRGEQLLKCLNGGVVLEATGIGKNGRHVQPAAAPAFKRSIDWGLDMRKVMLEFESGWEGTSVPGEGNRPG